VKRAAAALLVVAVAALAWIAYRHLTRPPPPSPEVAASGTLTAVATVQVSAPAAGEVMKVMVDFNTPVRRGQVLARLGPPPERAGAPPRDEERSLVRAPIDGTVILRNVAPGQTVATGAQAPALFTIAPDLREMQLQATIAAADAARLRVGMQATLTVEAFPRRTFTGEVRQIRKSAPRGQPASYTVVLDAANPELALLPGMTAQARIAVEPAR
jgi:multidrug efflux pump subunit AcrA (membrane-fusion protein)